jgi:2-methylcitrate dehydratase PrpD
MNITEQLCNFCSNISLENIPEEIVQKAKLCLLDYFANAYGSLKLQAVQKVIGFISSMHQGGNSTVFGTDILTNVTAAAFINGTTAEAIEAQDGVRFGGNHPVSAIMPAALTLGEHLHSSGKELIEAIISGYEAANRIAASMHPFHTLSGFLPTGTCGTFGAAATSAKLFHLDSKQTLDALGNAGYILPISMAEHLMGGHSIKIVQGGQAASAGIIAAGLASHGIDGFPKVLEGSELKGGFTQITCKSEPKLERIIDSLGLHYTITDVYIKPYTACRHTHGAIQATQEIMQEVKLKYEDIESINVFTYGIAALAVGKNISSESTFISAQFSIPYAVAATAVFKQFGPEQLLGSNIANETIIDIGNKVQVTVDNEINSMYPDKTASRVEIHFKNGKSHARQIDIPKGDPRNPMNLQDIQDKLQLFSGLPSNTCEQLSEAVMNVDKIKDINSLIALIKI